MKVCCSSYPSVLNFWVVGVLTLADDVRSRQLKSEDTRFVEEEEEFFCTICAALARGNVRALFFRIVKEEGSGLDLLLFHAQIHCRKRRNGAAARRSAPHKHLAVAVALSCFKNSIEKDGTPHAIVTPLLPLGAATRRCAHVPRSRWHLPGTCCNFQGLSTLKLTQGVILNNCTRGWLSILNRGVRDTHTWDFFSI
jgi:hypothetical protein